MSFVITTRYSLIESTFKFATKFFYLFSLILQFGNRKKLLIIKSYLCENVFLAIELAKIIIDFYAGDTEKIEK